MTQHTTGALLRSFRLRAGLTQEALGERCQLSTATISNLERGVGAHPYPDTIARLAEALRLSDEEQGALAGSIPRRRPRSAASPAHPAVLQGQGRTLPLEPTRLIGREPDVAWIRAWLLRERERVLTLTGPGGVGKTRLALHVAHTLVSHWADGACFVRLDTLADPALVPAAIASALRLHEAHHHPLLEYLIGYLHSKRLLLLLDSFDHVAPAADVVAALRARCPALVLLVTSRAPLRIRAEVAYAVPPLALPPPHTAGLSVDTLRASAAMHLLEERARAASPAFAVTAMNAPALAQLCRSLDGLPLALELAAARLKTLTPHELCAHLDDRLALLSKGPRDLPRRQQTMRATIAWSYDLLTGEEQTLFRRLAVFAGGCTLECAHAVCAPERPLTATVDELSSLIEHSVLRQVVTTDGTARFLMLDTIRAFARERLAENRRDQDTVQRNHAMLFLWQAIEANTHWLGAARDRYLQWCEQEHDNLRAALQWAWTSGQLDIGTRLAAALRPFWETQGYLSEGRHWLDRLLAALHAPGTTVPLELQAQTWAEAAALAQSQADVRRAAECYEACLPLYRAVGDHKGLAATLAGLGWVASQYGAREEAMALTRQSVALYERLGDTDGVLLVRLQQGHIALSQGDDDAARCCYEDGWTLARERQDLPAIFVCLYNLSTVALRQNDLRRAHQLGTAHLALARQSGNEKAAADALMILGDSVSSEDHEQAARLYEESLALARQSGDHATTGFCLGRLAALATEKGDNERALAWLRETITLLDATGNSRYIPVHLAYLAQVLIVQKQWEQGVRLQAAATTLGLALDETYETAAAEPGYLGAARAAMGEGAYRAARAAGRTLSLAQAVHEACAMPDVRP